VLVRIASRVAAEAWSALLAAPAPLDFPGMWALAEDIQRKNATELGVLTFALLGLWALAVFDAGRDAATAGAR
jgi:hypothetical protein